MKNGEVEFWSDMKGRRKERERERVKKLERERPSRK